MKQSSKSIFCLLIALHVTYLSKAQDTVRVVTDWLKQNSIPIRHIEPGHDFSDLQPLKKILQDVQVVGLGEVTHGTRENFIMKHRLVEFLVTEMGFTAFALESSYSGCQPINDYILTGEGDRATALTGQGYMAWDTEEFSAMLDWMRAYNQNLPDEKKVRFYGKDVQSSLGVGREAVKAFVRKYAPEKAAATDSLFRVLAREDEKWPTRLDQNVLKLTFMPLQELLSYFTVNKNKLVASSSLQEWEQTFKHLEVMEQSLYVNVKDLPPAFASKRLSRDEYMAQVLYYIMEKERPGTKFIVWQHNLHVARLPEDKTLGYNLHKKLGKKYYGLGFKSDGGTFQARELLPDGFWGDLKADTLLSVPNSLERYLIGTGKNNLFIDLRETPTDPVVAKWLEKPIRFNTGGWPYRSAEKNFKKGKIKDLYDGILFIERSSPVQPTKAAKAMSAKRQGF